MFIQESQQTLILKKSSMKLTNFISGTWLHKDKYVFRNTKVKQLEKKNEK